KIFITLIFSFFISCSKHTSTLEEDTDSQEQAVLSLPDGFNMTVVADSLGMARHIAVNTNGDIYVKLKKLNEDGHGILRLTDTDGDGIADTQLGFGDFVGTGIEIQGNFLYASSDTSVHRFSLEEPLSPDAKAETIVTGFPNVRTHEAKSLALDEEGNLFVNVGAPSNTCQEEDRAKGSPGMDPCPLLERNGGIWKFDANKIGQTQVQDGHRFATGIRNAVALDWNPITQKLFAVQHGRDMLKDYGFSNEQNAKYPAEELFLIQDGDDYGWPYCYYNQDKKQKILNPEYGGDHKIIGRCEGMDQPLYGFPGHWAPNDILFYTGDQFPARYKEGAFIAFHGSWNRAPLEQAGYFVVFLPFDGDKPTGEHEVFMDGFAGAEKTPRKATHRPVGLAQGPDGSLFISDSKQGKIWKVSYEKEEVALR
ncbi:MAG: PQQ-dependent sugar dehydrogenase, partial [Bacteroidota bacterium]